MSALSNLALRMLKKSRKHAHKTYVHVVFVQRLGGAEDTMQGEGNVGEWVDETWVVLLKIRQTKADWRWRAIQEQGLMVCVRASFRCFFRLSSDFLSLFFSFVRSFISFFFPYLCTNLFWCLELRAAKYPPWRNVWPLLASISIVRSSIFPHFFFSARTKSSEINHVAFIPSRNCGATLTLDILSNLKDLKENLEI